MYISTPSPKSPKLKRNVNAIIIAFVDLLDTDGMPDEKIQDIKDYFEEALNSLVLDAQIEVEMYHKKKGNFK